PDVLDLGQVLDDRRAQRIGDQTPLNRRCASHVDPTEFCLTDRIGSPRPVNSDRKLCSHARSDEPRGYAAAAGCFAGMSFRRTHTKAGQANAAMVQAARIAETGRSKNGRMLPSDL